ncbi:amiloride-sensitive sodium channel domain-containing protein [Ditylenchus destructor]|uniref:Amiloride-sensitive sodium channel domain-containing protein n=1 Tax=Ditylenchus destructor TaxID=166010 RepID=A0AAD4R7P3_9BILA|nr:amiloride-sensitive sodium channel domain-containing protein [Ditylenchus destructor]
MRTLLGMSMTIVNVHLLATISSFSSQSYYQISASIAKWPARAYMLPECAASNQVKSPYWSNAAECMEFYKSNTLLMDVYFETTSKEVQKEFQGYKVLNFVADAGGTIGLWLGMSIVSVIEFLLFLFMLCRYFINRPAKVKIDPGFDYFASLQQQTQYADLYHLDDHEEETLPPPVQDSR